MQEEQVRFEAAMERLEEIVERMEGEALELDEALALYEEGVRLLRATQGVLDRTETRIHELLADGDGVRLEPWEPS
ncbi:MAG TPA: exodeoxyribonuclease VII small subunit [Longimicrobiaceae bacterium]|nr:exodeoxyribonuclease VII small subunit [Longimicrobiaceae bacterium]